MVHGNAHRVVGRIAQVLAVAAAIAIAGKGTFWAVSKLPVGFIFSHSLSEEQQFRIMTGLPLTPDVTDIEGIGGGWQGYDFWLRFRCNASTVEQLVASGFEPADADLLEEKLDFESQSSSFDPDHFSTPWDPGDIRTLLRYENSAIRNEWTESGATWFTYDPANGWVHLYSSGT